MRTIIAATLLWLGSMLLVSDGAAAQQDCKILDTCEESRPKPKPKADRPARPQPDRPIARPAPPQPSRCDRMWQAGDDTLEFYERFIDQCAGHGQAAIAGIRAAEARSGRCAARWIEADRSGTAAALKSFAGACPTHQHAASAGERVKRLETRQKLDTNLAKWGLNYRQWCGLDYPTLLAQSKFESRRAEAYSGHLAGDTVASTLVAYEKIRQFLTSGFGREDYFVYLKSAADGGDPRAMTAFARELLDRSEPEAVAADVYLQRAAEQDCAIAMRYMGHRTAKFSWQNAPRPTWTEQDPLVFFRKAADLGDGYANCSIVEHSYDYTANQWLMPANERKQRYDRATSANNDCGELALLGQHFLSKADRMAIDRPGGCAYGDKECVLNRLRQLSASGSGAASYMLATALLTKEFGSGEKLTSEIWGLMDKAVRQGDEEALSTMALISTFGRYNTVPNPTSGRSMCNRLNSLGNGVGTACLGMLSESPAAAKPYFERAELQRPCSAYGVAMNLMPVIPPGSKSSDLPRLVRAMPASHKKLLKEKLSIAREAFVSASKANGCSSSARTWIGLVDEEVKRAL